MNRFLKILAAAVPLMAASLATADIVGSRHDFSAYAWSDNEICKPCHTPHNAMDNALTGRLWAHDLSTATYKYHGGSTNTGDQTTRVDNGSGSVNGVTGMDTASRLCLGCHDGTVALDSFMGKDGGKGTPSIDTVTSSRNEPGYNPNIGAGTVGGATADLSNDHPVGFSARYNETYQGGGHYSYKPLADAMGKGLKFARVAGTPNATPTYRAGEIMGTDGVTPKYTISSSSAYYGYNVSISCVTCHNVHNSGAPDERGLLRISNQGSNLCLTCHDK